MPLLQRQWNSLLKFLFDIFYEEKQIWKVFVGRVKMNKNFLIIRKFSDLILLTIPRTIKIEKRREDKLELVNDTES